LHLKVCSEYGDRQESIRKRLVTYEQSTRPIIEYFRSIGKVREVNSHRPIGDVYTEVELHFANAVHAR
jgi:adenylate kinase family enzyme